MVPPQPNSPSSVWGARTSARFMPSSTARVYAVGVGAGSATGGSAGAADERSGAGPGFRGTRDVSPTSPSSAHVIESSKNAA